MVRYRAALLLTVMLAAGCASMDTVMSSWVARSIDGVTATWGAPESRMIELMGELHILGALIVLTSTGFTNADNPS